jgi:hypothetical protein
MAIVIAIIQIFAFFILWSLFSSALKGVGRIMQDGLNQASANLRDKRGYMADDGVWTFDQQLKAPKPGKWEIGFKRKQIPLLG